jgi:methionine biosynthesis protein MetW
MKHQEEIHDDSWESRKPNQYIVARKPRVDTIVSLLENLIDNGDQVFDLGCGDGTVGALLKDNYRITIDGCDISEVAVDRAQNHYRTVHQLNIDNKDIPVESESYDIVICTDVLEHTLSPGHPLTEVRRILKNDGVTVISVPNYGFIRYRIHSVMGNLSSIIRDKRHYSAFTVSHLHNLLDNNGLDVQTTLGISRLRRLANIRPHLFAKTIIVTANVNTKTNI